MAEVEAVAGYELAEASVGGGVGEGGGRADLAPATSPASNPGPDGGEIMSHVRSSSLVTTVATHKMRANSTRQV